MRAPMWCLRHSVPIGSDDCSGSSLRFAPTGRKAKAPPRVQRGFVNGGAVTWRVGGVTAVVTVVDSLIFAAFGPLYEGVRQ
jgi:hypothetical protein